MRYKIKPIIPKVKDSVFLFATRFCGNCGLGLFLERVPINVWGNATCPICGEQLWWTKQKAREEYGRKLVSYKLDNLM